MSTNLDLLRSIAVLCVLANHTVNALLHSASKSANMLGRLGVLLFFVHTALVLMESLQRHGRAPRWAGRFYVRRLFRIYPLSIFTVLVAVALQIPNSYGFYPHPSWAMILSSLLLIQNVTTHHSVFGPLWSLPYEVQMYLLLPAIYVFLLPSRRRYLRLAALLVVAVILARISYDWPPNTNLFSYFPCFIGGVVAYELRKKWSPVIPAWVWPFALVLLCLLYTVRSTVREDMRLQWGVGLFLGAAIPLFRDLRTRWITLPGELVARYSYGIYLSHIFLIWLFLGLLSAHPVLAWPLFALSLVVVPVCLYHWLEKPMMDLGARLTHTRPTPESHLAKPDEMAAMSATAAS